MNCPDLKPVLIEYLDGRLPPDRAAAVRAHVESCAACRREADLHQRAWDLAGGMDALEPDPSFAVSVRRRIRRSRLARMIGSCAAAAALIAALFVALGRGPLPAADTDAASRLNAEDRRLLEELARDRTWELADNMEVVRTYELLVGNGGAVAPEEDH